MRALQRIEQLADLCQTALNAFVGVVLVMGIRVVPDRFAAGNSIACLIPAGENSTEDDFEQHAMVKGHGVIPQMMFDKDDTLFELFVFV
jgi:hypothetical protein